jgi:hypothetical protein
MKTSIAVARYVSRSFVVCTAAILVLASCARAQFGGTPSSSQSTPVNPLPALWQNVAKRLGGPGTNPGSRNHHER